MIDNSRLMLRPAEAAQMLGVSTRMVYLLIQKEGLPVVRTPAMRIPVAGLKAWVAARTVGATDPHPGQAHDPEPRPYIVGTRAYVAKVCTICGLMLEDGRK